MNLTLARNNTQPSSSSASAAAGVDGVDSSIAMDTSQSDAHDIAYKQDATASLVDGASDFAIHQAPQQSRPTDTAQQASGITAQQFSSMLSAEFQRRIDSLASQISLVDEKVQPVAKLTDRVNNIDARVSALENSQASVQQPVFNIENLAAEIQDRFLRSQNIILYGVAEVNGSSQQVDIENVTSIFILYKERG